MKPNVILLDSGLRSLRSLPAVKTASKTFARARAIVIDLAPVEGDIRQFAKAGASGFVLKDATFDEFLRTIRAVAKGEKILPL